MKSFALYNNKGGVGKTTTAINIAYTLSYLGNKVLIIDFDGQQNISRFFADEIKNGLTDVIIKPYLDPCTAMSSTRYESIDIITSTPEMNDIITEFNILSDTEKIKSIQNIINFSENPWHSKKYDFVIADLPPTLNKLTETVMAVCDYVFVPIELSSFAIQGIANVTDTLNRSNVVFGGCIISKFDRQNPSDYQLLDILKTTLGNKVFDNVIPMSRVIKNSTIYKLSALEYMDWTEAVQDYVNLTKEIISVCERGV